MRAREEFEEGLKKYAKLELLWTAATVLAIIAYFSVPASLVLGAVFFFAGGIMLSAAGIGCAYTIAKENI